MTEPTGVNGAMHAPVDLWLEDLSADDAEYDYYWHLLDAGEQLKAKRFIQKKHRLQYVISHGKLRTVLAGYTGLAPETIRFAQEARGKPYMLTDGKPHQLQFNLSHSGNKMLVAVGFHGPVGVDIEAWDDRVDNALIADTCFASVERLFWEALPDSEKNAAFYQFWTRKESFAKAVGAGLALDVATIVTSIDGAAGFLAIPDAYGPPHDWKLLDLDLGQGLSGALAAKSAHLTHIRLKTFRDLR